MSDGNEDVTGMTNGLAEILKELDAAVERSGADTSSSSDDDGEVLREIESKNKIKLEYIITGWL